MDITWADFRDWAKPPNLVSFMRLLLIGPVVWLVMEPGAAGWWGWLLLVLGALTDKLDGWLAKRNGGRWTTKLGKWLDSVIDKAYIVLVLAALGFKAQPEVQPWLVGVLVALVVREWRVMWIKAQQLVKSAAEAGRFSMLAQSVALGWLALPWAWSLGSLEYIAPMLVALGASYCSGWHYEAEWQAIRRATN